MRSIGDKRTRVLSFTYRSLIICLALLGLVIIGGTVFGLLFHNEPPDRKQADIFPEGEDGQIFTGIGQIRVPVPGSKPGTEGVPPADSQPGMVILFVSFIYHPEDKAFSEELALRVRDFRQIITDYIGSFSAAELQKQGEDSIKAELLRRFNAILRLGQIETLYFSDFMILG